MLPQIRCFTLFLLVILSVCHAENSPLRRRRTVVDVDHASKDRAAELLNSLWDLDGIQPDRDLKAHNNQRKRVMQKRKSRQKHSKGMGGKEKSGSSKKSKGMGGNEMSFNYYF
jgi:hypothetical protein